MPPAAAPSPLWHDVAVHGTVKAKFWSVTVPDLTYPLPGELRLSVTRSVMFTCS